MNITDSTHTKLSDKEIENLIKFTDARKRNLTDTRLLRILMGIALSWSIFQVWISSPMPFIFGWGVFSNDEARKIHLAFSVLLAFLSYPAFKSFSQDRIPASDWLIAIIGSLCALYPFIADSLLVENIFGTRLSDRPSSPLKFDIFVSIIGIILLLEATRRSLGLPLMIVAIVFLSYTFLGSYAPEIIAWKGSSFGGTMDHQWLSAEGVFGIALGVSTNLVFLFVLFGALLERAGASNYFIQLAFSLMGHFRGGPAKAAIMASGMTGVICGSSIANVVTTGTFTIPMMKRVGLTAEKAGAIEVASSVNGQIMPPVMGAAAFLMVEYVNISYFDVIRHAFLPAIISYIALVYIVHLEAMKMGLVGLKKATKSKSFKFVISSWLITLLLILGLSSGLYYISQLYNLLESSSERLAGVLGILILQYIIIKKIKNVTHNHTVQKIISTGALILGNTVIIAFGLLFLFDIIRSVFNEAFTPWIISALLLVLYVVLVKISSAYPDLVVDSSTQSMITLPETGPTVKSGLHFLMPVAVLIWMLMVERLSPSLSAFYATVLMIVILLTQKYLFAFFRKENKSGILAHSFTELVLGMTTGAHNMVNIGIATATAGIIVGAVSQTGVGLKLSALVEFISMGHIFMILFWTAILSLILGMGLPTTANYIVVSSLLAPVIISLGQQNGLIVPLIAVHMFVFYFGIMADVTPPVGLASFAAAAVSGGRPILTGFIAFFYSLRTALLPFLFIFNTDLLLIDVTLFGGIKIFIISTFAMLIFTSGFQGYFLIKSRIWESLALVIVAFTLFHPTFWMDRIIDPYKEHSGVELTQVIENAPIGTQLRILLNDIDDLGDPISKTLLIDVEQSQDGQSPLENLGLDLIPQDDNNVIVDGVRFASTAEKAGFRFDQVIYSVGVPSDRPLKELFYIPAIMVLGFIAKLQRRRQYKMVAT